MRIAVFTSSFPVLSETFIINQIIGLIDNGAQVDILTNSLNDTNAMHKSVREYGLVNRVNVIGIKKEYSFKDKICLSFSNLLSLILKGKILSLFSVMLDRCLNKSEKMHALYALNNCDYIGSYEKIICHFGYNGYYMCKLRDLNLVSGKVYTVFHGAEISKHQLIKKYKNTYQNLFKKGDLMLPISDLWARRLVSWGCEADKVRVHRMGVNIENFGFNPTEFDNVLKVIQVGRLTEKKAILDSIKAIHIARNTVPVELSIIGDGELYQDAADLIEKLDASRYIKLLGRQPQEVVIEYLNSSHVFLLPSVTATDGDMEGIPVALMEAMSMGLIVVSTYHSGIPELIENNVSGFLVDESSVDELAKKFEYIYLKDKKSLLDIQKSARKKCIQSYDNLKLNSQIYRM